MPPAANIDDVIAFAGTDIPVLAYGIGPETLFTQMNLWNVGVFSTVALPNGGIFPPSANVDREFAASQRPVTDWYAASLLAVRSIVGPLLADAEPVGVSACVDAVVRLAYAVKYARIALLISAAQQTAVVTLYNTVWQ